MFECPLCPEQKREGIEVAGMRDVRNGLVLDVLIVSSPNMSKELKFSSFAFAKCWSVRCVQTKRERVLRVQGMKDVC